MKIIIPTYKENAWAVKIYMHLHNKYWPDAKDITLLAENDYSSGLCEFVKIPQQYIDPNGSSYSGNFSTILMWYLNQIADENIVIMLADYWLIKPVNHDVIMNSVNLMSTDKNILRIQFGNNSGVNGRCDLKFNNLEYDYYECGADRNCFLTTQLTPGIWSKSNLLKIIKPNWSAWDVEVRGASEYIYTHTNLRSLGVGPEPIHYINAIRGRDQNNIIMHDDIVDEIKHIIPSHIKW